MSEQSKVEQELVRQIAIVTSEELDCPSSWLEDGGNSYLNTKILDLIKEVLPELAKGTGYLAPDEDIIQWARANGYVLSNPNLDRGSSAKELPSVIGMTLTGEPLIKQVGGK